MSWCCDFENSLLYWNHKSSPILRKMMKNPENRQFSKWETLIKEIRYKCTKQSLKKRLCLWSRVDPAGASTGYEKDAMRRRRYPKRVGASRSVADIFTNALAKAQRDRFQKRRSRGANDLFTKNAGAKRTLLRHGAGSGT